MKFEITSSRAAALVALIASAEAAKHGHGHARHHETRDVALEKKGGQCQFPTDAGLVSVTPNEENAGWAMSPNQPCKPGNYCPYACPPGEVSMQWDPKATSYSYPMSMNGGLYCDESGKIQKPFPDRDYCESAVGVVKAHNKAGKPVSFCQTVLPGNEAMIIPTMVEELADLAVPGTSYWCSTAAQYYINAPGVSAEEGCVWGTNANPFGNWAAYTAGANTDDVGDTYLKIGWNPIYLELTCPFRNTKPDYGIEIECEGDGCKGLPCKIDPAVNDVNEMIGDPFTGAGGATGCVVTVPKGESARIVVFEKGGSGGSSSETISVPASSATSSSSSSSSSTSTSTSTPTPTPTSTSTSTTETPTSTPTPTSTSTPTPSSTSTSTATPTSSSTSTITSSSTKTPMSSATPSGSTRLPKSSPSLSYTYQPHVLTGSADISEASSTTGAAAASSSSGTGGATSATVSMMTLALGAVAAFAMNL